MDPTDVITVQPTSSTPAPKLTFWQKLLACFCCTTTSVAEEGLEIGAFFLGQAIKNNPNLTVKQKALCQKLGVNLTVIAQATFDSLNKYLKNKIDINAASNDPIVVRLKTALSQLEGPAQKLILSELDISSLPNTKALTYQPLTSQETSLLTELICSQSSVNSLKSAEMELLVTGLLNIATDAVNKAISEHFQSSSAITGQSGTTDTSSVIMSEVHVTHTITPDREVVDVIGASLETKAIDHVQV